MTKREKKLTHILWRECKSMLVMLLMKQPGITTELINQRWEVYKTELEEESKQHGTSKQELV